MRVFIKGGTWKNSEDEVLKAAIMKYGKNNWSRVASLLNRKSAKQCKARWQEWLDPSIKKGDWTREEEEKLLHLAKIMPCQWRTIAPIVGRTPAQCLEHYERLLDQAQAKEGIEYNAEDDPRRLRQGEIDPNPETRPARPDAVDMEEDEKEMLSEARARLANTKGKKAKRKAREKQLEEAKRLATLQKKRELKAAGIIPARQSTAAAMAKEKKRPGLLGVNYNLENPFAQEVPMGIYDTSDEAQRSKQLTEKAKSSFVNLSLQQLKGKRQQLEEHKARKQDTKKLKEQAKTDLPTAMKKISRAVDGAYSSSSGVVKRGELLLPAPQVSDQELEEIGKMGAQFSSSMDDEDSVSGATSKLLSDYKATAAAAVGAGLQTPALSSAGGRTPAQSEDSLLNSVKQLAAMTRQQTPLVGGQNLQVSEQFMDFAGVTPRLKPAATPNPLAQVGSATPALSIASSAKIGSSSVAMTPIRDSLRINEESNQEALRSKLKFSLQSLPKPSTEKYSLRVALTRPENGQDGASAQREEDAGEELKRRQQAQQAEQEELLRRRSSAKKRGLPIPEGSIDPKEFISTENDVQTMIDEEFVKLLERDLQDALDVAENGAPARKKARSMESALRSDVSSSQLEKAKDLINEELNSSGEKLPSAEEFALAWEEVLREAVFDVNTGALLAEPTEEQRQAYQQHQYEELSSELKSYRAQIDKLQKKLQVTQGGYQKREQAIVEQLRKTSTQYDDEQFKLWGYEALAELEGLALPKRIAHLREEVTSLQDQERTMQREFRELSGQSNDLRALLSVRKQESSTNH